jgi:hypothetical protein
MPAEIGIKLLKSERHHVIISFMAARKKYWYRFTVVECPVCGGGEQFKEREYTPKPKDPSKRHTYLQIYDYCLEGL